MSKTTIRNIVTVLLAMLLAVSVFSFMVFQVLAKGERLMSQIKVLEKEQTQEASYIHLQRISEQTFDDRAQLEKYFLARKDDSIYFLNEVEAIAPKVGVSLETKELISYIDESDNSEWIQVSFEFGGARDDVYTFVQILETLPYVSQVIDVEMEKLSRTEWKSNVTVKVRVLAYDK